MKSKALLFIATKLVLLENEDLFDDEEIKLIRANAFLSCVVDNEVCVSVNVTSKLSHKSPRKIIKWCDEGRIVSHRQFFQNPLTPPWYEIPLKTLVDLKKTDWNVDEYIHIDIKKVDF